MWARSMDCRCRCPICYTINAIGRGDAQRAAMPMRVITGIADLPMKISTFWNMLSYIFVYKDTEVSEKLTRTIFRMVQDYFTELQMKEECSSETVTSTAK